MFHYLVVTPIFVNTVKPCYMRKLKRLLFLMPCASVFFMSCKNEDQPAARLLVANMTVVPPLSPNPLPTVGVPVDVKWGGKQVINNIVYGAASSLASISSITSGVSVVGSYNAVSSGVYPLNFAVSGSVTGNLAGAAGSTVYNRLVTMSPGKNYTAVALDLNPFYRVLITEDDLSAPPVGKVKLRFVHAISPLLLGSLPRKDSIDVTAFGGPASAPLVNVNLFPLRTFADGITNKNVNQYVVIDSGSYQIGMRVAGTPGTSAATGLLGLFPSPTTTMRFVSGKIYTIIGRLQITAAAAPTPAVTFISHN